jgi:hypothetical protein|tara:strand:- start:43 stop:213 length:171 start_codon:yes stop_codon:yes gene_type:complete
MTKINLRKAHLCNVCNKYACYHDGKNWWCSLETSMGSFNMTGVCKNKDKNDKLPKV